MNREAENALLLLVGVGIAMVTLTGAFTRYVRPGLAPWLLVAAAVLIVLAVLAMARDIRAGSRARSAGHDPHHGHQAGTAWLLLVPIVLLVFIVPPPISPRTARPTAVDTAADGPRRPFPALPDTRAPELSLPELLIRLAHDSAGTVEHRTLTLSGFTMRDGTQTDLGRVVIICCAADAQLARIRLGGPAAPAAANLPDGTWVRIEGAVAQQDPGAAGPTRFDVTSVTPAPRPPNAYSY